HFHTYPCFTLFNIDYQLFTRLKIFTLFEVPLFYLFCTYYQALARLNLEWMHFLYPSDPEYSGFTLFSIDFQGYTRLNFIFIFFNIDFQLLTR
ncbi:MAG: hypothetical protein RML94_15115, partial [Bacteroidia bacterium]|nr:hypothetical protein [Bacteroidia bacterium]